MKTMLLLGMILLAGCGSGETTTATANEPAAALPKDLIATTQPADAKDVVAAKASAKEGTPIVLRGWIGGSTEPLASNRAVMTLMDASIPTCDKTPMDTCKTPW